jgi:hypothetical protein
MNTNDTKTKLTLITIDGQTVMAELPVDGNDPLYKAKVDLFALMDAVGIPRNQRAVYFG